MSDYQSRRGGLQTPARVFVNVDNDTMFGNGTIETPLRAADAAPTPPTVQQLDVSGLTGAVDGTSDVTFVTFSGSSPASVTLTLADGTVDGFRKRVAIAAADGLDWALVPTSLASFIGIAYGASGGTAMFVWSADAGTWYIEDQRSGLPYS